MEQTEQNQDIVIVGTGAAGLFCALQFPEDRNIWMITKETVEESDSFLAQGGICVLKGMSDYESYFEDTMRAGHYENNTESVELMIKSSPDIIQSLIDYGVEFEMQNGKLQYTREGAHSTSRILYHEDLTGKEISTKLWDRVKERKNITILEHTMLLDLICEDNTCHGVVVKQADGKIAAISANYVLLACGGIGGLFEHSTNFPHLTGDALAIALQHDIRLKDVNYIQIHPTTLYSTKPGRRFLISESVRGEGAKLYNKNMERFVDELLPRDLLTAEIRKQMEKDDSKFVWLSMVDMGEEEIKKRFPNIYKKCVEEGYDPAKECIPVTPAQHYYMGGIWVDIHSKTSMNHLYAIGETSCNGVHGANRLASNSLLESLVFARAAAEQIQEQYTALSSVEGISLEKYKDFDKLEASYKKMVLAEIERMEQHV
ncbi:MAG: L-aspartate oxidase [Lachnospiraceae bacterium]|nr:L-aspartate oxidase [Lachnospiraceae bacterium]